MSKCNTCVTDKNFCVNCIDNPIYKNVPKKSLYKDYIPFCPFGYSNCVNDPEYLIKYWDKFSDQDALISKNYCKFLKEKFQSNCPYYDTEDK